MWLKKIGSDEAQKMRCGKSWYDYGTGKTVVCEKMRPHLPPHSARLKTFIIRWWNDGSHTFKTPSGSPAFKDLTVDKNKRLSS
jgi:hypothetical protein